MHQTNERVDWHIYRDIFLKLIDKLPHKTKFETENLVNLIDSSPIRLDLATHEWAEKTQRIEGIKLHLMYDMTNAGTASNTNTSYPAPVSVFAHHGAGAENHKKYVIFGFSAPAIPTYFEFSGARTNDIEVGKKMDIQRGCTYVFDKGYMDFNWWNDIDEKGAYFVTRLKRNNSIKELTLIQEHTDIVSSQLIQLSNKYLTHSGKNRCSDKILRRVIVQREGRTPLILVTNDLNRSSEEIAELYKQRWQIELFFKWIKQNLKIKKFLGRSENAVKTQICIALISFVLVHLMKELKQICRKISRKNLLKIIGNNMFCTLKPRKYGRRHCKDPNQLQFQWCF